MKRRLMLSCVLTMWLVSWLFSPVTGAFAQDWEDLSTDIDRDGLLNTFEEAGWYNEAGGPFVTDPQDADSDDDGLSDGEEKLFGTNPLDNADPGIYVRYQNSFLTRDYYRAANPDYISMKQGGDKVLLTEALVVRRGTTFSIGGPTTATLTLTSNGLTALSAIKQDAHESRWIVTLPAAAKTGHYTATLTMAGWATPQVLPIYAIFELPTGLSQTELDAYVYNDDPDDVRDETSVWWYTSEWAYDWTCAAHPGQPCDNEKYHYTWGNTFAFWTHQYEKDVFLTHVMPRIEGKSTPSEAITSLTSWANHESRVDYDGINNNTYAVLERYWDSNVGCYTQFGGACQDQANLLTAFLRSAGIAARPFIVDWNRTPGHGEGTSGGWYDTSALVWQYNDWRVSRSYGSPGEEPACYPFDEDNTSTNRSIYNWYPDSSGDLIVASNATWDWNAVSTVWPDIWSDFTNGWEYSWDSRRPLELQGKSPQIDTLNIPSWQGDGWRPNDFGTAVYQLPNPYPGGNMLENWPIEPKPKACTPQHVGSCPYPTVLAAGEALTVAATLASPTVAPQYSVYLPLAMNHAQPPAAQLRPIQDEYAVDLNGNGRFDALIVEAVVDVARAGDYTLGGFLALPGGTATYGGVFADKVTVSLAPGTHIIPLTFEGLSIGKAEASEPYIVDHLWISDFADFDGRLGPWDKVTDLLQAGNVIDRYPSEKFEKLSAELADVYQHRGVDQDGDGLYDALAVDVSFDVVAKRPFRVEGALYDRQGNFAGQAVWTGVQSPATLVFDLGPVVAAPYQLARVKLFEDGGAFLDSRDQASYTIAEVGPSLTDGPITLDMYPTGVVRQGTYVTPTNVFTDSAVDLDGDGRYDQLNVAVQMQVNIPGTYRVEGWLQDAAGTEFVYTLSDPTALLTGTQALTLTFDGRAINQRGDLGGPYTVVALRILSAAGYTVLDQVHETDLALAYAPEEFEPVANAIQVFGDDMEGSLTQWASWESPWNLNTKTWPLPTKLWKATAVSPISGTLTSQVLDLSDYARPMLQFNTTYTLPTPSQGYIEVSTGGPTWSKVVTYSNGIDRWATGVLDLAAFGEKPTVKLRFAADVRNNAQWHIDDVYLYAWPAVKSASFTHTPATIMPNEPITFTASYESITDTLPITYTWDFDDGSVIVTSSPTITHQFTNDEDRLVTLVVANPYDTAEYARVLSVHQPVLQTSFTYTITALEVGVPLTFTASYTPTASDPPITYTWNFGDNGSMMTNAAMISHTYAHGGTYNVQLTTANKYGAASANHIFEIDEGVGTVSFTYAPETPMEGEPIMFGVNFTPDTASQPITYTWDFGDGAAPFTTTSPNIEHTFTAVGVYLVTITADNGYGVPVTYQTTIVITGRPLSDVTFVVAQAGLTNDYTAIFTPTYAPPDATTPVTYTWNFGDGPVVVSGASSITHTFTASGNPTHTVYLTATNGYETTPITYVQSFIVPFDDDGDGLANSYEINIGTDPHNPDTDGDGRTDGEEVTGYLYMGYSPHVDYGQWITTDPTDADSDNDGVSDGNEFTNGTHPGDSDTDDDGLNDGLEPGTNGMPSALDPDSDDDGLLDGEEVLVYYTSPVLADTDEDTLSDPMEVFTTTTSPLDPDMDEDGRLDGAEWYGYVYTSTAFTTVYTAHPDFGSVITTSPLISDTDGDLLHDGYEFLFGTHPGDPDTDDDGIDDYTEIADNNGVIGAAPIDTDGDGIIDAFDDDSDDDGVPDSLEGAWDVDDNGIPNWRDPYDNYPPVAVDDLAALVEDASVVLNVLTNDRDLKNDALSLLAVGFPKRGSVLYDSALITYTPDVNFFGTDAFTYTVSDGILTNSAWITITVNSINDPPAIEPIADRLVTEGIVVTFPITATDVDPSDILTLTLAAGAPDGAAITSVGEFVWTPTEAQGPGVYPITVQVTDGALDASETFTITVTEVNVAPVLAPIGAKAGVVSVPLTFAVVATDADVPTNTLTFSLDAGAPAGAALTPGGQFSWTPATTGTYTVTVRVTDDGTPALEDAETFQIIVTLVAVNLPPVLNEPEPQTVAEGTVLALTVTATDPNVGDTLTFSLDAGAPDGAGLTPAGAFTWTPTEAQGPGEYAIPVQVTDGELTDSGVFTVTVTEVNVAPVLTPIGAKAGVVSVPLTFAVVATDADVPTNTLTFSLDAGAPAGAALTPGGQFSWTPATTGTYTVTVRVADDGTPTLEDAETFQIIVTLEAINLPPTLHAPESQTVDEGVQLSLPITATDPNAGDILTLTLTADVPEGAVLTPEGVFTWTPTEAQGPGVYPLTVAATDGELTDSGVFTITVNEVNVAPVLAPIGAKAGVVNVPLTFAVAATDADVPTNTLTFSLDAGAPAEAALTPDGQFSWTPATTGTYTVTVRVTDDGTPALEDAETFQIIVTLEAVNFPPTLVIPEPQTVAEGAELALTLIATDPNVGDILTFTLGAGAPDGAALTPEGAFTWTPTEAQGPGDHAIPVEVTDGALSASGAFTVTVTEVNVAPVLAPIEAKAGVVNVPLTFAVVATDADVPTNTLAFSLDAGAPAGAAITRDGQFSWTPPTTGTYTVTVRVTDDGVPALADVETFQIDVKLEAVNQPPVLNEPEPQTASEGAELALTITATDPNVGDILTFTLGAGAPDGAVLTPAGAFTWTPTEAQGPGIYSVTVQVTDGALSDAATFTVTVNEVNVAPVLAAIANQTINLGATLTFTATATDSDLPANTLTFSLDAGAPDGAAITPLGQFSWTPTALDVYTMTIHVRDDGQGQLSDSQTFTVTVQETGAFNYIYLPLVMRNNP